MQRVQSVFVQQCFFDDVSDNYGIDDWAESYENYMEPGEGDSGSAEDATFDDYCCS
jgi:hypothetical protein